MENSVQPNNKINDEILAFYAMFVLLICVECSKEPEFRCDFCDKVYKQEGRFQAHIAKCGVKDSGGSISRTVVGGDGNQTVSVSEFSELLRQNREMLALLQKQQETIQTLVSQFIK